VKMEYPINLTAVIAAAIGPSGKNDEYLFMLDSFLLNSSSQLHLDDADHTGDSDTKALATMTRFIQQNTNLFHFFAVGSNQHEQLLLQNNQMPLIDQDQILELTESVLVVPKEVGSVEINRLYAGGGHSALVTNNGTCYLWGCNELSQLGSWDAQVVIDNCIFPITQKVFSLKDLKVDVVALGHDHSLVIEKNTGWVYAFGNNRRQQCGQCNGKSVIDSPAIPEILAGVRCIDVAAGVFHSAVITEKGELITFGCPKISLSLNQNSSRWQPQDGSRLVKVCCGKRHTVALDEFGRIWTFGENIHGQLGRQTADQSVSLIPELIEHPLLRGKGCGCFHIDCGWSHNVALVKCNRTEQTDAYVWGRNDRGQLGLGTMESPVVQPRLLQKLSQRSTLEQVFCGSESSLAVDVDGVLWSSGWNEHGNLGLNHTRDVSSFTPLEGLTIGKPRSQILVATGSAHTLVAVIT
jgi:alpha-tubulin suppressor-like RCC1 family protein